MENIFWLGYSNEERSTVVQTVQTVISKYGDIIDFKFFSDISVTVALEIKECSTDKLYDELRGCITMDKHEYLASISQKERTVFLNITFSRATGNLSIETPSVPG